MKILEEKLASVSSTPQENKHVSYVDSLEVSRKKKHCVLHEIRDSDDALSDISSEELGLWSSSEDGQMEDGFQMPSFNDLSTAISVTKTRATPEITKQGGETPIEENEIGCFQNLRETLIVQGISSDADDIIQSLWRLSTKKQYETYIKRWLLFVIEKKLISLIPI